MNEKMQNKDSDKWLPESLDGPIAAPEHHKVVFENDVVRVVEFRCGPGEKVPIHSHKWPCANYVISLSDFVSYDAGGGLKSDSRSGNTEIKEGEVFWLPAYPPPHSVENIGNGAMHGIAVEIKS
jgi:quercetin dioxygenase-like cupin family protein